MRRIPLTMLAAATACAAIIASAPVQAQQPPMPPQLVTNGPQFTPGDGSTPQAAQQNVRESTEYEALLHTNPTFRDLRIRRECGPISDPQLRASCLQSFGPAASAR